MKLSFGAFASFLALAACAPAREPMTPDPSTHMEIVSDDQPTPPLAIEPKEQSAATSAQAPTKAKAKQPAKQRTTP